MQRRIQTLELKTFDEYRDYLEVHQDEFAMLFNTILINVTSFFRDPPAWDYLQREVIPVMLRAKSDDGLVRVWSAGCAAGQEAYSLAIALAEAMGDTEFRERAKVYATDVDEEALTQARHAAYLPALMEGLSPERLERFFESQNGRHVFRADLRRTVIFGRNDLVQDAPISRLDLLVCRNTLMYFNAEAQAKILARFHFALNGDGRGNGYLFLGRAEMLLTHGHLFSPLDLKCRVFAKVPPLVPRRAPALEALEEFNGGNMDGQLRLREQALEESPTPRIVVDAQNTLAFASARARVLFSLSPKDIGRPLQDLEISYRPIDLRSLIEQAFAEHRTVTQTSVERRFPSGESQYFDVVVAPLYDDGQKPLGAAVSFVDVTRSARLQEELRRSQEEIQTTNEELQSTNEELQTVNEELRTRSEELNHLNSFFESVLGSLSAGAVVVNQNLDVLMWNHRAEDLWGLRADEAQGKGLLNLDIGLPVQELRGVVRASLAGETGREEVVLDAVNRRGKKIKCRVICSPLVTPGKKREGVILTMEEV